MLEFESKLATAIGNTIKFKVTDPSVLPQFLYYWVQHLYNNGSIPRIFRSSVIVGVAIRELKTLPFYNRTLGDVAEIGANLAEYDFEMTRVGSNAGKLVEKTASHIILAAASDAKKNALMTKYRLSKDELDFIADIDPTANGAYTEWICKAYKYYISHNETPDTLKADLRGKLELFEKLKNSPQWRLGNQTDINRYSIAEFLRQMDLASRADLSKKEKERDLNQNQDKYALEGSQLLGDTGPFRVYKVTTVEASQVLSKDTHWCTKGEGYAASYLKYGPLYVVTTPGEDNEDYASDKFCQIFAPSHHPDRIECQDINGDDLGEHLDDGYIVSRSEFWELFEFIAKFDPVIKNYIEDNTICKTEEDYWDGRKVCDYCDSTFRLEDGVPDSRTHKTFCSEECFKDANYDYIKETVVSLLSPFEPQVNADSEEAEEEWDNLYNSPDSPLASYFQKIRDIVKDLNGRRAIYDKISPEIMARISWQLATARSASWTSNENRARIYPGISEEEFVKVYDTLNPLYTRIEENFEHLVDEAIDDVKRDFDSKNRDIRSILVLYDYLNEDGTFHLKESSWNNGLLIKDAAASQAKKDALAKKYKLDPVLVETLSNIDPTPNGEYTDWLCKAQSRGEIASSGAREDYITSVLQRFSIVKRPGTPFRQTNSGDINSYTVSTLVAAMEATTNEDMSKKEQERKRKEDIEKNKQKYLTEGSEYLGEVEGGYLCFRVTTMQASEILGKNTHWCTRGTAYGPGYLAMAPLYIFTLPGSEAKNSYNDDKFLQIFVPDEPSRIEAQDVDGRDVGRNVGGGYWVNKPEYWKFFEFLSHHDEIINDYISDHTISQNRDEIPRDEATCDNCGGEFEARDLNEYNGEMLCDDCYNDAQREYCPRCGESYDSDDMHFLQAAGESYCDSCWDEVRDEFIKESIDEIFAPFSDVIEQEEAKESKEFKDKAEKAQKEWEKLKTSPGSPLKKYFEVTKRAVDIYNESHTEAPIDLDTVDIRWHLSSINGAIRAGDARRESLYPGVPLDLFEKARDLVAPLVEAINQDGESDFRDGAFDYVQGEFESSWGIRDIKASLVRGGYLNPDFTFKVTSAKTSRKKMAAISKAKHDALVKKYGIPESVVGAMDSIDSSPNGEYVDWLCREYKNKRLALRSIVNPNAPNAGEVTALLERFSMLKRPGTPFRELNSGDINQYHYESLVNAVASATRSDLSKNEQRKEIDRQRDKYFREGCEVVGRRGDLILYRITTPEASVIMSQGTNWCTQGERTSRNYLESGPLYVITQDADPTAPADDTSDKLAQIYCPDLDYIECQNTKSGDLGDRIYVGEYGEDVQAYWVANDTYWEYMQFVGEHDPEVNRLIKGGFIYHKVKDLIDDMSRAVWKTSFGATLIEDVKRAKPSFTLVDAFKLCPTWLDSLWAYDSYASSEFLTHSLRLFKLEPRQYDSLIYLTPENYKEFTNAMETANVDPKLEKVLTRGIIFTDPKQISWDYVTRTNHVDPLTLFEDLVDTWSLQDLSEPTLEWARDEYPTCHYCNKPILNPSEVLVRSGDMEVFCSDSCYDADDQSEKEDE